MWFSSTGSCVICASFSGGGTEHIWYGRWSRGLRQGSVWLPSWWILLLHDKQCILNILRHAHSFPTILSCLLLSFLLVPSAFLLILLIHELSILLLGKADESTKNCCQKVYANTVYWLNFFLSFLFFFFRFLVIILVCYINVIHQHVCVGYWLISEYGQNLIRIFGVFRVICKIEVVSYLTTANLVCSAHYSQNIVHTVFLTCT